MFDGDVTCSCCLLAAPNPNRVGGDTVAAQDNGCEDYSASLAELNICRIQILSFNISQGQAADGLVLVTQLWCYVDVIAAPILVRRLSFGSQLF